MLSKGKEVAGKAFPGKRRRDDGDKSGGRQLKNRSVLQFFEDAAGVADNNESEDSEFEDDFMEEEFDTEVKDKNEPGKAHNLPIFPKEEELSEEEFERILEERYKAGSKFVRYAEDDYETKKSIERNSLMLSAKDPTIWKVKCMVGREKHSAFCLMQKYVDLQSLGTKLQIISAFAVEHIKGFIYIEADKQSDINQACKGLCSIYSSRVATVPRNEISHLLSVRSKYNEVSEGTWARVKNGKYKGDLAQVVAVNYERKRATVKLIPRINLQALAEKFGMGATLKKIPTPAARLICSSELEEFRPLIQYRRDRDTGIFFEILDGLMLKDGYLYKKVSIDSLSCWAVMPSDEELQKFNSSKNDDSENLEWLTQIYGKQRKKRSSFMNMKSDKGGGKGEGTSGGGKGEGTSQGGKGESTSGDGKGGGSSGFSMVSDFELHDLVCFGQKDFGVVIGVEKDNSYKILKASPEGPIVVTVELRELKNGLFDTKFTALDFHKKTLSVNDTARILEGPSKGRQGIVKKIYRGVIFLYDENEMENSGYFCSKSQLCEKINLSDDAHNDKGAESGLPGFEDSLSSPKSPLSPKKPWQTRGSNCDFNRGGKDGMFSIGQTLRIKVGPLKGFLCRVLAIHHSDVTVKLDSRHKVLTVKCEHLSEVRGKNSTISISEDPGSSSLNAFDLLGTQGCSADWMEGAGTAAENDRWNAGGLSTERSASPSFPASGFSLQPESSSANPFDSVDNGSNKDGAWERKVALNQDSSWGSAAADDKAVANSGLVGGWGKNEDAWGKASTKTGVGSFSSDSWGKAKVSGGDQVGTSNDGVASSENRGINGNQENCWKKSESSWDKDKNVSGNLTSSWNCVTIGKKNLSDAWSMGVEVRGEGSTDKGKDVIGNDDCTWGKAVESQNKGSDGGFQEDSWGKTVEKWNSEDGFNGSKADWKCSTAPSGNNSVGWGSAGGGWTKPETENSGQSSGWKRDISAKGSRSEKWQNIESVGEDASSCGKGGVGELDQIDIWNKPKASCIDGGSWNKQGGGSSWNKANVTTEDAPQGTVDVNDKWKRPKIFNGEGTPSWKQGGVPSWKQTGESSWSKNDDWSGSKSFGGDRGFGSWNKGRTGGKNDTEQQNSWERPKPFEGDRGSGGRRGRGGTRGGRDQFGRGRSFGRDQSSGWNIGQENSWSGGGTSLGKPSGGNNDQVGGWGKSKVSDSGDRKDYGWDKPNVCSKDNGPSWNKGWAGGKDVSETGDKWTSAKLSSEHKSSWNNGQAEHQDGTCNQSSSSHTFGGKWNASKSSDAHLSSGWNKVPVTNEESSGSGAQDSNWNMGKASVGDQGTGWASGTNAGKNESTDWNSKVCDWNSSKTSQTSSWNKRFSANEETGGAGKCEGGWKTETTKLDRNLSSSWGNKTSWDTHEASQDKPSGWGMNSAEDEKGGGSIDQGSSSNSTKPSDGSSATGWGQGNSGKSETSKAAKWGNISNWNSGNVSGGDLSGIDGSEYEAGSFGGRGIRGNWRGRGGSDRGGFGGRSGSEKGGFGGRGHSHRGGFGGKGRGWRDQSGGWNNRNDSGENKSFGWNKGADNDGEGQKSNDSAVSGSQGSRDKSKLQGWSSGTDSTKGTNPSVSLPGGWGDQNSGGNQSAKDSGGWDRGIAGNNESGGIKDQESKLERPTTSGGGECPDWSPSAISMKVAGASDQGTDWNPGTGSLEGSHITNNQPGSWSSQGSGWNQSKGMLESGVNGAQSPGWDKATTFAKDAGGSNVESTNGNSQVAGWNRGATVAEGSKDVGNNWKSSSMATGGQTSGWMLSSGDKETIGTHVDVGNWNKQSGSTTQRNAAYGRRSSGWHQSNDAKEGSHGNGEATDSWGKAAASSLGKGTDGNSKGGW